MSISGYSTNDSNNNGSVPEKAPDGMLPSQVISVFRRDKSNQRTQWNDAEWFEFRDGTPDGTVSYVGEDQFKIGGLDSSAHYHVGRRVKITDNSGDVYASITDVSFASDETLVTVDASLANPVTKVCSSILSATNDALPREAIQDVVGQMLTGNTETNITVTYRDTDGTIDFEAIDTVYTHPTSVGNKHIPSGGSSGQILRWSSNGTAVWGTETDTVYTHPTTEGNKHIPSGGSAYDALVYSSDGTAVWSTTSYNAHGQRTVSTAQPSGGADGDIWYVYE